MNYNTIQKQIFSQLLSGTAIKYQLLGESVAVTDNFKAYVIPLKKFYISLDAMETFDISKILEPSEKDKRIKKTGELWEVNGKFVERYESEDKSLEVWINPKLTEKFTDVAFYAYDSLSRILVKDFTDAVVGVVMPVRKRAQWDRHPN